MLYRRETKYKASIYTPVLRGPTVGQDNIWYK